MKTGKIILNDELIQISFEQFPSITLGVTTNTDGTKQLSGDNTWDPLKLDLIHKYGDSVDDGKYNTVYLHEHNSTKTYKLTNCELNSNDKELVFENCQLFE